MSAFQGQRPSVAILREQGVNGQVEMAAAFDRAGFEARRRAHDRPGDGRVKLGDFRGLAACGGFSYGDVLGAGRGWATSILYNDMLREQFAAFFADESKFTLGVCNGCQMLAQLKEIIPGAKHWPTFLRNTSEQYEARLATLEVLESDSLFFKGMARIENPGGGGAWRGSGPIFASLPGIEVASGRALRRQSRQADRGVPAQPERLARRPGRLHCGGRPRHRS